jgi:hypothetical protein
MADVGPQLKMFRDLRETQQPGWEKHKPTPDEDDYLKFVRDVLTTHRKDLADALAPYSATEKDWFGTIQKSYPDIPLLDLVWQTEREHEKFAPRHDHAPGVITRPFSIAHGAAHSFDSPTTREPKTDSERRSSVRTEMTTLPPDFVFPPESGQGPSPFPARPAARP